MTDPTDPALIAAALGPISDGQAATIGHLLSLSLQHNDRYRAELVEQIEAIAAPLRERYLGTEKSATPQEAGR